MRHGARKGCAHDKTCTMLHENACLRAAKANDFNRHFHQFFTNAAWLSRPLFRESQACARQGSSHLKKAKNTPRFGGYFKRSRCAKCKNMRTFANFSFLPSFLPSRTKSGFLKKSGFFDAFCAASTPPACLLARLFALNFVYIHNALIALITLHCILFYDII